MSTHLQECRLTKQDSTKHFVLLFLFQDPTYVVPDTWCARKPKKSGQVWINQANKKCLEARVKEVDGEANDTVDIFLVFIGKTRLTDG